MTCNYSVYRAIYGGPHIEWYWLLIIHIDISHYVFVKFVMTLINWKKSYNFSKWVPFFTQPCKITHTNNDKATSSSAHTLRKEALSKLWRYIMYRKIKTNFLNHLVYSSNFFLSLLMVLFTTDFYWNKYLVIVLFLGNL